MACTGQDRAAPLRSVGRNLTMGFLAGLTTAASQLPVVAAPPRRWAERHRAWLFPALPLPHILRVIVGFLLLDDTLYVWQWMNHRSPLVWRFHAVHHSDLALDASTGVRSQFGELALSAGFRAGRSF